MNLKNAQTEIAKIFLFSISIVSIVFSTYIFIDEVDLNKIDGVFSNKNSTDEEVEWDKWN